MNRMSRTKRGLFFAVTILATLLGFAGNSFGDAYDTAVIMGRRLTGETLDPATLQAMAGQIQGGNRLAAANIAISSPQGMAGYYNTVINAQFTLDTTKDRNPFEQLNDYVLSVIGMIQGDIPFNQIFSLNTLWVGDDSIANIDTYQYNSNNNPGDIEREMFAGNINIHDSIVPIQQSSVNGFEDQGNVAGLMTSQAIGRGFMNMGTNRSLIGHYIYPNIMCESLDDVREAALTEAWIARDVLRNPAGKPSIFARECKTCHTHIDAARAATCNMDFDGQLRDDNTNYLQTQNGANVHKCNRNEQNYPPGKVTTDNSFAALLSQSPSHAQRLGFRGATTGYGIRELGEVFTRSTRFSECMVERAHKAVCNRAPLPEEEAMVKSLAAQFESQNYNFKWLTMMVATLDTCLLLTN